MFQHGKPTAVLREKTMVCVPTTFAAIQVCWVGFGSNLMERNRSFLAHSQVCCAWDMYITMYSSEAQIEDKVSIPSVYVTMRDGQALLDAGEIDVEVKY